MPHGVDLYQGAHNSQIRWDHLLRQTSDWQGTLWVESDWADRPEGKTPTDWPHRPLRTPGSYYTIQRCTGRTCWRYPPCMSGVNLCPSVKRTDHDTHWRFIDLALVWLRQ